jgi:hypothetical protein
MIRRMAISGAAGDLTFRFLLPALAELHEAGRLPDGYLRQSRWRAMTGTPRPTATRPQRGSTTAPPPTRPWSRCSSTTAPT